MWLLNIARLKETPGHFHTKVRKSHISVCFQGEGGGLKKRTFCPLALMCVNVTPSLTGLHDPLTVRATGA